MTTIKRYIGEQIRQSQQVEIELSKIRDTLSEQPIKDEDLYISIMDVIQKYPGNENVLLVFLDFLQLANSKNLIEQYELDDVDSLFKHLCKYYPLNYTIHLEYYYFLFNVLDRAGEAKQVLAKYLREMTVQLGKMEKLVS